MLGLGLGLELGRLGLGLGLGETNENLGASHHGVLLCAIIDDILYVFDEKWS